MWMLMLAEQALTPAPSCDGATLPATLAGWNAGERSGVRAGTSAATAAALSPGRGTGVALRAAADLRLAITPRKKVAGHGGLLAFEVAAAGRYRIAASGAAWLDVVRDGKPLSSAAHAHGPSCSGIRKMVDFDLVPGRYLLQIVGSATPTLRVMVTRAPS